MVGMVVVEAISEAGGGGVRAHVDVGASGRTQTKRRKQLAVRWYCVSCEKSSKHEQDVVTLLCLQCGVSMVSSKRQQSNTAMHRVGATATAPPKLGAEKSSDHESDAAHGHAKVPAARADSTNDCVCIVLQGALSLARVRLSFSMKKV